MLKGGQNRFSPIVRLNSLYAFKVQREASLDK